MLNVVIRYAKGRQGEQTKVPCRKKYFNKKITNVDLIIQENERERKRNRQKEGTAERRARNEMARKERIHEEEDIKKEMGQMNGE